MPDRPDAKAAFDRWVRRSLQERYAPALREPLPEALLHVLDATDRAACALGDAAGIVEPVR